MDSVVVDIFWLDIFWEGYRSSEVSLLYFFLAFWFCPVLAFWFCQDNFLSGRSNFGCPSRCVLREFHHNCLSFQGTCQTQGSPVLTKLGPGDLDLWTNNQTNIKKEKREKEKLSGSTCTVKYRTHTGWCQCLLTRAWLWLLTCTSETWNAYAGWRLEIMTVDVQKYLASGRYPLGDCVCWNTQWSVKNIPAEGTRILQEGVAVNTLLSTKYTFQLKVFCSGW